MANFLPFPPPSIIVCLSVCISLCLSICLSVYLPVCLSVSLTDRQTVSRFNFLLWQRFVCPFRCLPCFCSQAFLLYCFYHGETKLSPNLRPNWLIRGVLLFQCSTTSSLLCLYWILDTRLFPVAGSTEWSILGIWICSMSAIECNDVKIYAAIPAFSQDSIRVSHGRVLLCERWITQMVCSLINALFKVLSGC